MTKRRAAKPSVRKLQQELEIAQGNLSAMAESRHNEQKHREQAADMDVIRRFVDSVHVAGLSPNALVLGGHVGSDGVARQFGTKFGSLIDLAQRLRRNLPL
jgi:hypothetical protein